jgi:hypothetical protein
VVTLQAKTKPADIIKPTTHARKTLFNEKTGANVNEILAEEREYLSGSAGFSSTRVRVYKVVSG